MLKIKQNTSLILASSSPVRKQILVGLGLEFKVIEPDFDEEKAKTKINHLSIKERAIYLAAHKALSISIKYPKALVIGSDQICQLGKSAISKSKNQEQAILQLKKLSGKIHYQNNATCLYFGKKQLACNFDKAKLTMRKLSDPEIESYVNADKSWNCAGSYKLESLGKHLFTEIKGNQDCILGMSFQPILSYLYQKKLIEII
jgi:septum formation protein